MHTGPDPVCIKKIIVILLDRIFNHLICYRTNFGFYYQYRTEILDYLCIEPRTKVVVDSFGEPHWGWNVM